MVFVLILTRLPQLLSQQIRIDGDESIVGIMAREFLHGKVSLFFFGQKYGFSLLEEISIALFYGLENPIIRIKLGAFLLFVLGVIFFYQSMRVKSKPSSWIPFCIALLFIFTPGWMIWSMKARGGYLSAFFLFNLITYLLYTNFRFKFILLGLLSVLTFQAQPLWLIGLLPILTLYFKDLKDLRKTVVFTISSGITWTLFTIYKSGLIDYWSPSVIKVSHILNLENLPTMVLKSITGWYSFYAEASNTPWVYTLYGILFLATFAGFLLIHFKTAKWLNDAWVYLIAIGTMLAFAMFTNGSTPRYLLPIIQLFFWFTFFTSSASAGKKLLKTSTIPLIIIGISISFQAPNHLAYSSEYDVIPVVQKLKSENIRAIYTADGNLQWKINYLSDGTVVCRTRDLRDRRPDFIKEVDCRRLRNENYAICSFLNKENSTPSENNFVLEPFFILKNPGAQLLRSRGFTLSEDNRTSTFKCAPSNSMH